MKITSLLAAAAALALSGCAIFNRSATWERVVDTRADYAGPAHTDGKDGYINRLHQVLSNAGVEHKVVTYHFRYHNVYREETVETATAVIYRDDTTPRNPWWVMDEYHHVPTWLPSWALEAQLEFFIKREVEIVEVKAYGAAQPRTGAARPYSPRRIAQAPRKHPAFGITQAPSRKPSKPRVAAAASEPATSAPLSNGASPDKRAAALFRSTHGTAFNPKSSVDRAKMSLLTRSLLNRNQSIGLRPE